MPRGKILRMVTLAPAIVHWSADSWKSVQKAASRDSGLGVYAADLSSAELSMDQFIAGTEILFTFFWPEANHWEGTNFSVTVENG